MTPVGLIEASYRRARQSAAGPARDEELNDMLTNVLAAATREWGSRR